MRSTAAEMRAEVRLLPDGRLQVAGHWNTVTLAQLQPRLRALAAAGPVRAIEAEALQTLDTGGAWLLLRLWRQHCGTAEPLITGLDSRQQRLLAFVAQRLDSLERPEPPPLEGTLAQLGRWSWQQLLQVLQLLAFLGESVLVSLQGVLNPLRIRWRLLLGVIEQAGLNAIPIIALLSFLLGVVIAYQGGVQLQTYGANIFIVELITLTTLRELGPMMAAIIVAGRSGSAYTAEIATMNVTEEVDAMKTLGFSPMELLVLPKLLGLMVALPLLTVLADVMGVLGGMVMARYMLEVDFIDFMQRMPEVVPLSSFLLGVGKAVAFAAIIALVGCFQGFRGRGGADSVGRQTTISVVQSIFLVIMADAVFSIVFTVLGI